MREWGNDKWGNDKWENEGMRERENELGKKLVEINNEKTQL